MRRPIENNSSPSQAVFEPFSGLGTTIIAAEMSGGGALAQARRLLTAAATSFPWNVEGTTPFCSMIDGKEQHHDKPGPRHS
jgi:hypothetical protein